MKKIWPAPGFREKDISWYANRWFKNISMFIFSLMLMGCGPQTQQIGFVGTLSGKMGDMGIAERNGAQLRIELANSENEVPGVVFRLIDKDDKFSAEGFRQAADSLVADKIVGVIGPVTSNMATFASLEQRLFFISPTATSDMLSGCDDMLFRLSAASSEAAEKLGNACFLKFGAKTAAVLYDKSNEQYSRPVLASFCNGYEAQGGRIVSVKGYASSEGVEFKPLLQKLFADQPDAFFAISSGPDAAIIFRWARQMDPDILTIASPWAISTGMLKLGGSAVNGTLTYGFDDPDDPAPVYHKFIKAYQGRFGVVPTIPAKLAYDAAGMFIEIMKKTDTPADIKKKMLARERFTGLTGDYTFDRFGEAARDSILMSIENGKFQRLQ